jgi:hypothetical protein
MSLGYNAPFFGTSNSGVPDFRRISRTPVPTKADAALYSGADVIVLPNNIVRTSSSSGR